MLYLAHQNVLLTSFTLYNVDDVMYEHRTRCVNLGGRK